MRSVAVRLLFPRRLLGVGWWRLLPAVATRLVQYFLKSILTLPATNVDSNRPNGTVGTPLIPRMHLIGRVPGRSVQTEKIEFSPKSKHLTASHMKQLSDRPHSAPKRSNGSTGAANRP